MDTMAKCGPLKLIFPINLFNVDVELYLEIIRLTMRMNNNSELEMKRNREYATNCEKYEHLMAKRLAKTENLPFMKPPHMQQSTALTILFISTYNESCNDFRQTFSKLKISSVHRGI